MKSAWNLFKAMCLPILFPSYERCSIVEHVETYVDSHKYANVTISGPVFIKVAESKFCSYTQIGIHKGSFGTTQLSID